MIEGLSHLTFIVRDLDRTEALPVEVLGAERVYDSGEEMFSVSKERFFLLAGLWIATMKGKPLAAQTYNHVAFKIPDGEYDAYLERIKTFGLKPEEGRPRVAGEGRSIYFYDDDNHLFELHSGTLDERLRRYAR